MKKITIIKVSLIFSLVFLTTNCATEEINTQNTAQSFNEAKIWFDNHKSNYNETVLKFVNELQWENSIVSNGEIGEVIEVPFLLKNDLSATNKEGDLYNDHHRLMFVKNEDEEFKLFYIQIFTKDENYNNLDQNVNYYNIEDNFDGQVYVQELSSSKGSRLEFANGKKVQQSLTAKMQEYHCVYYGYWGSGGSFTALYEVGCYGGGPTGDPETPGTVYGGGTGTPPHPSSSCPAGYSYKFGECILEKYIYTDKLDPCTKDVYNKLKNLKQADILAMIQRFSPGASGFNINMSTGQVKDNDLNTWAQTSAVKGSGTDVNMVFNIDYINGNGNSNPPTDLSVAATMAHEIIHAYMISQLEEYKSGANSGICDFPTIYEAFVQQEITRNPNILPAAHHELIAKNYVNAIASTIEEFNTGQPINSGFPRQVYLDIAWGGLEKTNIFNATYPNDKNHKNYQDRLRIFAKINTEKLGSQYGANTPVGTPCKK